MTRWYVGGHRVDNPTMGEAVQRLSAVRVGSYLRSGRPVKGHVRGRGVLRKLLPDEGVVELSTEEYGRKFVIRAGVKLMCPHQHPGLTASQCEWRPGEGDYFQSLPSTRWLG